jgi:hypothetical protein
MEGIVSVSLVGAGLFREPEACAELHGTSRRNMASADEKRRMNFMRGPEMKMYSPVCSHHREKCAMRFSELSA